MNTEIAFISQQLRDAYAGDPWFGRSVKSILADLDEIEVFEKLNRQHSILEILWHIITWREFVIDRLQPAKPMSYFEENDWRELDHSDKNLWPQGLERLRQTQDELMLLLQERSDEILENIVADRKYNFRKLLHGLIQHDIYHLGQIAIIKKILL
ncbi:MAG: DinB family protein [Bacteroidota bacterium]